MDIINAQAFSLDLKERILRVGIQELNRHQQRDMCAQMVLTEVILPERSKFLIVAHINRIFDEGAVAMLQLENENSGNVKGVVIVDDTYTCRREGPVAS